MANEAPKGWQWYNAPQKAARNRQEKTEKIRTQGIAFEHLNAKEQVAVLHYMTVEAVNRVTLYPTDDSAPSSL